VEVSLDATREGVENIFSRVELWQEGQLGEIFFEVDGEKTSTTSPQF